MRSISLGLATGVALLLALPAAAADIRAEAKAVVELFTSQGCSSCPKADAIFNELGKREDIIALAWHVDYWDYIGWPDTFGSKVYSDRQRAYADSWGSGRIYTPQVIVNGRTAVVGSRDNEVINAIDSAALSLPVEVTLAGDMVKLNIGPREGSADAMVWLVTFIDRSEVMIERGENAGNTFDYTQIVTGRQLLGMWDATTGTALKLPLSALTEAGSNGAAILIQSEKDGLPGPILGAVSIQL